MEKNGDCIGSLRYEYRIADHLGNTRAVYADTENDGEAELLQEEAYYPFGMRIPSMSKSYSGSSDDRYLYNGKELEGRIEGFHFYDYGARFYDAALGRWHSVDPLAEDYTSLNPYNYVGNNPMLFIDPDGMRIAKRKSEDTKRYKASIKRTKTGRKIWRRMVFSHKVFYFHYINEFSEGDAQALYNYNPMAGGTCYSGAGYEGALNGEDNFFENNTFNKKTGKWEQNDKYVHIVINETAIEDEVGVKVALGKVAIDDMEEEIDIETHGVEVHEGVHGAKQKGYDMTEVTQNEDGTYTDTGITTEEWNRVAEKEARNKQKKAKDELQNN